MLITVIKTRAGYGADRRLALDGKKAGVVLDLETGLGGVIHAPGDDGRDFNRVAGHVVNFECWRVEIDDAQRDVLPLAERVVPEEAAFADGPGIAPEEDKNAGNVGLQNNEAFSQKTEQQDAKNRQNRRFAPMQDAAEK